MAMIICPDCGKEQDNLNKFCRNCGADLSNALPDLEINEDSISILEDGSNEKTIGELDESAIDKCSSCGAELKEGVKFCPNCGNAVKSNNEFPAKMFCPGCGEKISSAVKFCPNCGFNLNAFGYSNPQESDDALPEMNAEDISNLESVESLPEVNAEDISNLESVESLPEIKTQTISKVGNSGSVQNSSLKKQPIVSIILSFIFPGLGQFYNGQSTKGIYFIIFAVVSLILLIILIGAFIYLLVWLWSIIDAYNSAEKLNNGEVLEDKLF